jgi:hypothetical protein
LSNNVTGSGTPTFSAIGPSDTAAEDGGIIVKGTSDKTFLWRGVDGGVTYNSWLSSEHMDLATGKNYYVNGILIASDANKVIGPTNGGGQGQIDLSGSGVAYTLGSAVTGSSLTSVGTLTALRVDGDLGISKTPTQHNFEIQDASSPTQSFWRGTTKGFAISAESAGTYLMSYESTPLCFSVGSGSSYSERFKISDTSYSFANGVIEEPYHNDTGGGIQSNYNHDILSYGEIFYGVTNAVANFTFNVRGNASTTFNDITTVGKATTVTVYVTANSKYLTEFRIDNTAQTVKWADGSAPSSGSASGVDVYAFTIMKTAASTYHVFGNVNNFG